VIQKVAKTRHAVPVTVSSHGNALVLA